MLLLLMMLVFLEVITGNRSDLLWLSQHDAARFIFRHAQWLIKKLKNKSAMKQFFLDFIINIVIDTSILNLA